MNEKNKMYFEGEALKLKSLLTVIAVVDTDKGETLPEVVEVVKVALDIAESLYCAIADAK